jgi:hypothetical protein
MYHRYQNLKKEDNEKRWFNFRGWFKDKNYNTKVSYQICSGPACQLSVEMDYEDYGPSFSFIFGLLFFSLYLTVPRPKFWKWGIGRQFGFYWMHKECRIFWNEKSMESGYGWYYYFKPLDILFGKAVQYTGSEQYENYQPIHFKFRGKDYQLDKVYIQKWFTFRTRVPFGLWHRGGTTLNIKIDRPSMHSGKGTTSYNCDDDGIYGLSCKYEGPELRTWEDRNKLYKYAVEEYCKRAYKSIKKYGRAVDDTADRTDSSFEYIGMKPINHNNGSQVAAGSESAGIRQ